jgi:hypothetical protein
VSALRGYWNRRRRGGNRQVDQIPIVVIAKTAGGSLVVEFSQCGRTVRRLVSAASVEVFRDQEGVPS